MKAWHSRCGTGGKGMVEGICQVLTLLNLLALYVSKQISNHSMIVNDRGLHEIISRTACFDVYMSFGVSEIMCMCSISRSTESLMGVGWISQSCKNTLCLLHYPRKVKFIHSFILSLSLIWRCEHAVFCVEILTYNVSVTHSCLFVYK